MGWKSVKEHYRIGHHVAFHEGEGLCIGSGYVHGLITIDVEARKLSHSPIARVTDPDCDIGRYWREINSDLDVLWRLINKVDTFEHNYPVFTYEGGSVVECLCEEYGWPNVTHDGKMMYENSFFKTHEEARKAGLRNAECGVENVSESVQQAERNLQERRELLIKYQKNVNSLRAAS